MAALRFPSLLTYLVCAIVVCIIALVLLSVFTGSSRSLRCNSIHVINLDKDTDRLQKFQGYAEQAKVPVRRCPAVNGNSYTKELALSDGIPESSWESFKKGEIGCFLSHKNLLRSLADRNDSDYHLIFEDDAILPVDLSSKLDGVFQEVPSNWDMIFLGVSIPKLVQHHGIIHTAEEGVEGNFGTFAYIVRHTSLPKINKHIAVMRKPIDNLFRDKMNGSDAWNIYILSPMVVTHDFEQISSITGKGGATT